MGPSYVLFLYQKLKASWTTLLKNVSSIKQLFTWSIVSDSVYKIKMLNAP